MFGIKMEFHNLIQLMYQIDIRHISLCRKTKERNIYPFRIKLHTNWPNTQKKLKFINDYNLPLANP